MAHYQGCNAAPAENVVFFVAIKVNDVGVMSSTILDNVCYSRCNCFVTLTQQSSHILHESLFLRIRPTDPKHICPG